MKGKVALITGSATGLGKMTALSLARQGCHIAINYVNSKDEAEALSREIEGFGVKSIAIKADIASEPELYSLVDQTEERLGSVDILVNNAGPFIRERRLFSEYSRDEIVHMVNGNLTGVMLLDHRVLPAMREKNGGASSTLVSGMPVKPAHGLNAPPTRLRKWAWSPLRRRWPWKKGRMGSP